MVKLNILKRFQHKFVELTKKRKKEAKKEKKHIIIINNVFIKN